MGWQFHPLILMSLAGGIIAAAMVRYGCRHRDRPSATIFIISQALVVVMALAHSTQLLTTDLSLGLMASYVQNSAITVITVLFVVVVLPANVRRSPISKVLLALLCGVPAISLYVTYFVPLPNAMYAAISRATSPGYMHLQLTPGPWFWVQTVYSYGLLLAGLLLVGERLMRLPRAYRRRPLLALVELFVAYLGHIALSLGMVHGFTSDLLGALTIVMLSIAMWMTFYYHAYDILPLARDQVLQNLPMGVITLDLLDRVLDANEAAVAYLGIPLKGLVHRPAEEALAGIPQLVSVLHDESAPVDLGDDGGSPQPYEVTRIGIKSQEGESVGTALMLRDISAEVEARRRLRELASYIPVCAWCGRARTPGGSWEPLATWLRKQGGLIVSHGMCDACRAQYEQDPDWSATVGKDAEQHQQRG